jgi:pyrimidine-nucleoside phosphorylase
MLIAQEVIRKKREHGTLSREEIQFMIKGFVDGSIPDYQMSALAMAIFLNGFDANETADLLQAMIASGTSYDWSKYKGQRIFVDKHSTGGVGDKTSLVILPMLVADGLDVPMVSGRGLGHTGGTLDKLEAMPGFKTRVDYPTFYSWIEKYHAAFGAQTDQFVPADKRLYALRDVTSTVESRALITASIMSKKLAEGLDALVLDVKFGSGAFMQEYSEAKLLAEAMVGAGRAAGCKIVAAMTNMDEPLGCAAGNSLEVVECLDIMQGAGPLDTRELSLRLAAAVACAARGERGDTALETATARMRDHLQSGRAYEIFLKLAVAQGANAADVERKNTAWIHGDSVEKVLTAPASGYVSKIRTRDLGIAILEMGGGRKRTDDMINPFVGITNWKKVGEKVEKGEPLCRLRLDPRRDSTAVEAMVSQAFSFAPTEAEARPLPLIREWIW